jgi:hypothetical protein
MGGLFSKQRNSRDWLQPCKLEAERETPRGREAADPRERRAVLVPVLAFFGIFALEPSDD